MKISRLFIAAGSLSLAFCFVADVRADKHHSDAPAFQLADPGTDKIVDYDKYGTFTNLGAPQYQYFIKDRPGLIQAVGEGVYPNSSAVLKDPDYLKMLNNGELEGSVWDYVNSGDVRANFFKWATNHDQPAGLREFYIAQMLERAGLYVQAIKAYQALVVHFPKALGSTFWKTPWYPSPNALDSISFLTRKHPELGLKLVGGRVRILNRFDDDIHNDIFQVDPGKIVAVDPSAPPPARIDVSTLAITRQLGNGRVHLIQYSNRQWQLIVDSAPYVVRGLAYSATPIGKSPDDGSLVVHKDWMIADQNKNGKIDGPYDSWVDSPKEPVGDFQLMKDMGVNTIRLYHHGYNKPLLMDLYKTYGIRVIMGDYLGAYTVGSGADWNKGTDYSDPGQQQKMLDSVREMVEEYKDEPYVVYWVLGNENNYANQNNSNKNPEAYYTFLNEAAKMIKSIDPNHPVALCNGDLLFLDKAAKFCPDVDIYGANAYRGDHGFGDSFWEDISDEWGKPAFISEYGCPAYHHTKSQDDVETMQADYLRNNWDDIERNLAGGPGAGNAIGGVLFEWLDEWWKAGPPPQYDSSIHDIVGQFGGPFPDGWSYEEWYGITSHGSGKNSPFERHLRKAYFVFKNELWDAKEWAFRGLPK